MNSPPRYLALDVGAKRIGIAVSDELGLTAQPVLTLETRRNTRENLRSIARLARRFSVVGIVIGNPLHLLSGDQSPRAVKTQAFAADLGALTGLPIHLWDERLTTHAAEEILGESGRVRGANSTAGRIARKRIIDQLAAVLILESFLASRTAQPHV